MASSSSSRVSSFISSLIVLACLFQQRCHLIKADKLLIDEVCDKTPAYVRFYCQDCFKYPECLTKDIKGLAKFSISCSESGLFHARDATEELNDRSTGQDKENCLLCLTQLDNAALELTDAKTNVDNGNNQQALDFLQDANSRAGRCLDLVGYALAGYFETFKKNLEVATNVVHQIPN